MGGMGNDCVSIPAYLDIESHDLVERLQGIGLHCFGPVGAAVVDEHVQLAALRLGWMGMEGMGWMTVEKGLSVVGTKLRLPWRWRPRAVAAPPRTTGRRSGPGRRLLGCWVWGGERRGWDGWYEDMEGSMECVIVVGVCRLHCACRHVCTATHTHARAYNTCTQGVHTFGMGRGRRNLRRRLAGLLAARNVDARPVIDKGLRDHAPNARAAARHQHDCYGMKLVWSEWGVE